MIEKKQRIRLDECKLSNQLSKNQMRGLVGGSANNSTAEDLSKLFHDDPLLAGCCPSDPQSACSRCLA